MLARHLRKSTIGRSRRGVDDAAVKARAAFADIYVGATPQKAVYLSHGKHGRIVRDIDRIKAFARGKFRVVIDLFKRTHDDI